MKQIPCPFCGNDESSQHRAVLRKGVSFDKMTAMLCVACGEPICLTPTGFRKPTADEHVAMASDNRLELARGAWLIMKEKRRPPIHEMWDEYRKGKLADFKLANIENDEELTFAALEIFLSGITLALTMFNQNLHDSSSSEDFQAKMLLIEAELHACAEMMNVPEEEPA